MADEFLSVRGYEQLESVGAALKAAGAGGLRRELLRRIRSSGRRATIAAERGALEMLPKGGGLAAVVAASRFTTRTRLSGGGVGVRIVATDPHDIKAIDAGTVRHPVYGNRRKWVAQGVTPGWFTKSTERVRRPVQIEITQAVKDIARRVEGSA